MVVVIDDDQVARRHRLLLLRWRWPCRCGSSSACWPSSAPPLRSSTSASSTCRSCYGYPPLPTAAAAAIGGASDPCLFLLAMLTVPYHGVVVCSGRAAGWLDGHHVRHHGHASRTGLWAGRASSWPCLPLWDGAGPLMWPTSRSILMLTCRCLVVAAGRAGGADDRSVRHRVPPHPGHAVHLPVHLHRVPALHGASARQGGTPITHSPPSRPPSLRMKACH